MKNSITKINVSICFLLGTFLTFAQAVPPPPPSEESGEIGGPTTPIDLYLYILGIVVPMIVYYYKRQVNYIKN